MTIAAVAASVAYSHPSIGLERRGILGTGLLAVSYLVLPVLLAGRVVAPVVLAALVAGGTATLLYKDVKDEAGDRLLGKRTPLVRWGIRRVDGVATALGVSTLSLGVLAAGWGWWAAALLGGLVAQLRMAATNVHSGRLLTAYRLLAVIGLIGMASAG